MIKREFPKNLFSADVKFGDEYSIAIDKGHGWMEIKLEKKKPPVMIDDDDTVSEDEIKKLLHHFSYVEFVEKFKEYAIEQHNRVNQLYDGKPYSFHLKSVVNFAYMFLDLVHIPIIDRANIISASWGHDTVEDTGITYNNLRDETNVIVANIVYALTNEKGKNRAERANNKYYRGIRKTEYADYVKLCDRMANVKHSLQKGTKSGMLSKYVSENPNFIWKLIKPEWYEIHQHLLHLLMGSKLYGRYRKANYKYTIMVMYLENMLNVK